MNEPKPLAIERREIDELKEALEALDELERRVRAKGDGLAEIEELMATVSRLRKKIN